MSNARIIEIPATRQIRSGKNNTMRKMRVAAYCRVSTEEEEQQGSFETQKLYYTEKINSTSEWELAGIYADDGISGIHTKKRDGFNQMIQDCKKKKIDLILTKSISRFARNTLDSIQYVRMLKAIGIAVIFEKENINTSTMNSEMILTVLSAFAQAESESISQNVARGKRMGFRQGKFPFPYGQILGYRKGLDGKPEVIPEEAEVIRMIFNSYLQGASLPPHAPRAGNLRHHACGQPRLPPRGLSALHPLGQDRRKRRRAAHRDASDADRPPAKPGLHQGHRRRELHSHGLRALCHGGGVFKRCRFFGITKFFKNHATLPLFSRLDR